MPRSLTPVFLAAVCCAAAQLEVRADPWIDGQKKQNPRYQGPKLRLAVKFLPGPHSLQRTVNTKETVSAVGRTMVKMQSSFSIFGDVDIPKPGPDGAQELAFTCRRVKYSLAVDNRALRCDTDAPEEKQAKEVGPIFSAFVGWKGTVQAHRGALTRPQGMEKLTERIQAAKAGAQAEQMTARLGARMREFLAELLVEHWGNLIPTTPVGPGDVWKVKMPARSVPFLGKTEFDGECLLRDIEEVEGSKVAVLDFAIRATVENQPVDLAALGPAPEWATAKIVKMSVWNIGTAHFNIALGLSTDVNVNGEATGGVTVEVEGRKTAMDLEVEVRARNLLTRRKEPAAAPARASAPQTERGNP